MPTIEVRSLDLRNPQVTAEPLLVGSGPIAIKELNYVWIYVKDVTTQAEVALRFQVVGNRLVLCSPHDRVDQAVTELHSFRENGVRLLADADIVWRAIMVPSSTQGASRTEVSLLTIDGSLKVDALNVNGRMPVQAEIEIGLVTRIVLPGQ